MTESASVIETELETALDEYFALMDKPKKMRLKQDIIEKRREIGMLQAEITRISKI